MPNEFVNLRTYSHYTIGWSISKIKDIVKFAVQSGASYASICDKMNLFGAVEFSNECIKNKIKPIIGCVLQTNIGEIPVFIKNEKGFVFISKLLTDFYYLNWKEIDMNQIDSEDLIVLTGSDSRFSINPKKEEKILEKLKSKFGRNLYVEIPHSSPKKNQKIHLADKHSLPIVLTNSVYFPTHESFLSSSLLRELYSTSSTLHSNSSFLQNKETVKEIFKFNKFHKEILEAGTENSTKIAQRCSFYIKTFPARIPKYLDQGEKTDDQFLEELAYKLLKKKLEKINPEEHQTYYDRVEKELKILKDKKFSAYFLVTYDYVKYAHENEILVGLGRGSATGSLVSYCLGITGIDPIKFDLIFERFLNPERPSMPDFDIDFDPEGREKIIKYVANKYGEKNVVPIITFGVLHSRGALKEAGRVVRLPHMEVNSICSLIPYDITAPITLKDALTSVPALRDLNQNPKYTKMFTLAFQLEKICKNVSRHACGIIITDSEIWEYCPLYRDQDGELMTQFSMKFADQVGLIKFDFLGLKTLTILHQTLLLIKSRHGISFKLEDIPLDDKPTYDLFFDLNLEGVFQFENPNLKSIIKGLRPSNINDLIALNALNRPGPFSSIPTYIKRKHGQEPVKYLHSSLESILKETYGVIVYQEQVMAIAVAMANYSLAESDNLRRAMGKKQPDEMNRQKERFTTGALKNGINIAIIEKVFSQMYEFAGYGFNKSHATPYTFISYYCAYLKAHYSLEFMVTIMSVESENLEKIFDYVMNLNKKKIIILPPSINYSYKDFKIEGDCVRYGFGAIRAIGAKLACNIGEEREKNGKYTSLSNFIDRNHNFLEKRQFEALVKSGALSEFGPRKDMVLNSSSLLKHDYVNLKDEWGIMERKNKEREAFGFYLFNPFEQYRNLFEKMNCLTTKETNKKDCFLIGGVISKIKRRRSGDKVSYAFIEIYDEFGVFHFACFSNVLNASYKILLEGAMLVFRIQNKAERFSVTEIYDIDDFISTFSKEIKIKITNKKNLELVSSILNKFPGNTKIILSLDGKNTTTDVKVKDCLLLREKLNKFIEN